MSIFWGLATLGVLCLTLSIGETKPPSRVQGGKRARIEDFPWQAAIFENDTFICGGAIIDKAYVLTAGHCAFDLKLYKTSDLLSVAVGNSEYAKGEKHRVKAVALHPGFQTDFPYANDLAILKLETEIEFNDKKKAIALPTAEAPIGVRGLAAGWGIWFLFSHSQVLLHIGMKIISNEECDPIKIGEDYIYDDPETYSRHLVPEHICGLPTVGSGLCHGDSGGSLSYNKTLHGIFSWQHDCGEGFPNVFTRVYNYVDWIKENTKLLSSS